MMSLPTMCRFAGQYFFSKPFGSNEITRMTPEKLFHALEHNHLLVIGSDFSNWLARLFLRMTKRRRLSDPRDVGEILADSHSLTDVRLVSFLQQVSVRTRMFAGAEEFVAELHRRWMARRGGTAAGSATPRMAQPSFAQRTGVPAFNQT